VFVLVGLDRPQGVDQVDALDADQPVVPPDFGEEVVLAEFVERLPERLEAQQLELVPLWDLEEVEIPGLESN
jgi:hypothetical protein